MFRYLAFLIVILLNHLPSAWAQWSPQASGVDVQLRGISAVSPKLAWASGAKGTVLRTLDSGRHWEKITVAGAEGLDFRDIHAFDDKTAYVLSIGPGEQSRIYKTDDGGQHWQLQFTNHDPKAFYDCFAFWDKNHGIAFSDSVDGVFPLIAWNGHDWRPLAPYTLPPALPNEGAFAASGTCIATARKNDVWFVTGGPAARVFHSGDHGLNWTVVNSPILSGAATQGIFSIAFSDSMQGVIVGGDYNNPKSQEKNAAFTTDGGKSWTLASHSPQGYRSAVTFIPHVPSPILISVGTSGSDYSTDVGRTWLPLDAEDYNAVSFAGPLAGWAVGPKGRIASFTGLPKTSKYTTMF
ncbi:MAG TPA: hypothetical protein VG649_21005 [Candidatus Angelobacter sp.]|jgi:photosystem II stability/assembly factor-like uncharacterized protein|nr:hypothetical protein [Candidatus Angelobacter sp.]